MQIIRIMLSCILLSQFVVSCAAQIPSKKSYDNYEALNSTLNYNVKRQRKIYKRAFMSKVYNRAYLERNLNSLLINNVNHRITEFAYNKIDSLKLLNLPNERKDSLIEGVSRKYLLPKVSDFLDSEDILHMAGMGNKKFVWNQKELNKNIIVSNKKGDLDRVSVPMYNLKGDIAAYMIENNSSLSMIFCRKNDKREWEFYCSATIWIE